MIRRWPSTVRLRLRTVQCEYRPVKWSPEPRTQFLRLIQHGADIEWSVPGLEASTAYKAAFQYFSEKVRTLQLLGVKPGVTRAEIKAAILGVEKARFSYSRARYGVAQQLLDSPLKSALPAGVDSVPAYTSAVAELLWECAGRPEGTAEADWYSAEEIGRLAREGTFHSSGGRH